MQWAILASIVVVAAMVVHLLGHTSAPADTPLATLRQMGMRVRLARSEATPLSLEEALIESQTAHGETVLHAKVPPNGELVWWGKRPMLAWLITMNDVTETDGARPATRARHWAVVISAASGEWLFSGRLR